MLGSATWILFLHSSLSLVKSLDSIHFFKYFLTISIHVLFGLPLFQEEPSACIEKHFLTIPVASMYWTCSKHFNQVSHNLLLIDPNHKLWYLDTCTSPTYLYRTNMTLVLVPDTAPILLGNKFNIPYSLSRLFHIVLSIFLLLTIRKNK